jgi:hypothetical protein
MKKGKCKNYDGCIALFGDKMCKAGLNIREITGGEDTGWIKRTPCLLKHKSDIHCVSYSEPSDEEIAEHEDWIEVYLQRMRKVGPTISQLKKDNPDGGSGVIDCPCCGGKLHWGIAACNGHCHGRCTTEGCLNWME